MNVFSLGSRRWPVTEDATRLTGHAAADDSSGHSDEGHLDRSAKRLGMTSRSLQRRLKDEGTSFNDVREQVRRDLSQRYLEEKLSIAEISFLLGFSEPSAFFRAFKRWTGLTPVEARRQGIAQTRDGAHGQSSVARGH